jgi:hypothetical protein
MKVLVRVGAAKRIQCSPIGKWLVDGLIPLRAGKRHSLGAGIFNHETTASGDQLSDLALTTRAAIRGDRSAAVTRLIFR